MNLGRLASLVMFSTCNEIPQEKKKRRFTVLLPVSFSVPLPPPIILSILLSEMLVGCDLSPGGPVDGTFASGTSVLCERLLVRLIAICIALLAWRRCLCDI